MSRVTFKVYLIELRSTEISEKMKTKQLRWSLSIAVKNNSETIQYKNLRIQPAAQLFKVSIPGTFLYIISLKLKNLKASSCKQSISSLWMECTAMEKKLVIKYEVIFSLQRPKVKQAPSLKTKKLIIRNR